METQTISMNCEWMGISITETDMAFLTPEYKHPHLYDQVHQSNKSKNQGDSRRVRCRCFQGLARFLLAQALHMSSCLAERTAHCISVVDTRYS